MAEYIDLDQCATGGGGGGVDPVGLKNIAQNQIDPATEQKQDSAITALGLLGTEATAAAILAKIIAAPSTEAKQDVIITALGGLATETTAAAILSKIIAAPSTEAKQDTIITALGTLLTTADFQARVNTLGQKTMAASMPVVLASDQSELDVNITGVTANPNQWEASVGNTDLTPLGIGATFTGAVESSVFSDAMVHVETDQDGTLFFDFTQDGVNFDTFPFVGFSHTANVPSFHIAVKGGQQFRVRFVNTSGVAQTFFRLYTYYGDFKKPNAPLGTTLTDDSDATSVHAVLTGKDSTGVYRNVNVTPSNNLKATLFDSQTNSRQIVDLNGAAKVGEAIILSGDVLYGQALSPELWKSLAINGGTTTGGAGEEILETNTTANGQMILQSVKKSRFMIAQFNINHFGIQLDPTDLTSSDTIWEWGSVDFIDDAGALNATPNGIFMRVTAGATPIWEVVSVKNGVETTVDSSAWNGTNASLLNKTPTLSVYEMQYNAGTAFFFQGSNFLHRIAGLTSTYAANYNFPVALRIRNINGNTTNRALKSRAAGTYRLGEERGELISRAITVDTLLKTGAGYVGSASLSRTGSGGGSGTVEVYDGIDATGILIGRLDVGGDDVKSIPLKGTFSNGLFIDITGSGTNTVTINFE